MIGRRMESLEIAETCNHYGPYPGHDPPSPSPSFLNARLTGLTRLAHGASRDRLL